MSLDAVSAAESSPQQSQDGWRALVLFGVYHLALGFALLISQQQNVLYGLGQVLPDLYRAVGWFYLVGSVFAIMLAVARQPAFHIQIHTALLIDVVALTLVVHASGGVGSGVGLLLAVSLAVGSLLTTGLSPFLFASLATIAVIGAEALSALSADDASGAYLHAGLLGIAFFSIASLDFILSRRLQASEQLVQEQELDLENLNAVNAFVIDLLDLGVIAVDGDHRVRLLNQTAAAWFGAQWQTEGVGNLAALNHDLQLSLEKWDKTLADHISSEQHPPLKLGSRNLSVQFTALGKNANQGTLILLRDMEQVQAEQHKTQLATIGQMSASLAHEIRNPLSAISQAAQFLEEPSTTQDQHRRLSEIILRNSERLDRVIDNILTLARRRKPHQQVVDLGAFVEKIARQIEMSAAERGLVVTTTAPPEEIVALTDPNHLEEVLHILADNALKYGRPPEGKTTITFSLGKDDEGRPVIKVSDNGPGIPPELASKIFDPFVSGGSSTGLGLFLARQLCEINEAELILDRTSDLELGAQYQITMSKP